MTYQDGNITYQDGAISIKMEPSNIKMEPSSIKMEPSSIKMVSSVKTVTSSAKTVTSIGMKPLNLKIDSTAKHASNCENGAIKCHNDVKCKSSTILNQTTSLIISTTKMSFSNYRVIRPRSFSKSGSPTERVRPIRGPISARHKPSDLNHLENLKISRPSPFYISRQFRLIIHSGPAKAINHYAGPRLNGAFRRESAPLGPSRSILYTGKGAREVVKLSLR